MYSFLDGSFGSSESLGPPRNKDTSDVIQYGISTRIITSLLCNSSVVYIALQANHTGEAVEGISDISPLLQVQYDHTTYDLQYSSTVDITHVMNGCATHMIKTIKGNH